MADGGRRPARCTCARRARDGGDEPVEFAARVRIDTPARGRLLPPRRHPPVRAASAARRMSPQPQQIARATRERAAGAVPQLLRDLLAARGPSGYETAPAARLARGRRRVRARSSTDVVGTPLALVAPEARLRAAAAAAAGDGPHRRDRADRHAHRRRRLPVVPRGRRLGRADPRRPARRPRHARRAGRRGRRQEADPPAARRGAQEGRRHPRAAHRHRRARRRAGARAACGSATSP